VEPTEKQLRTGFTTGTCATAASKAALLSIMNQEKIDTVSVLLPKGNRLEIKINSCKFSKNEAICSVIKDGGDDPDVTHGAEIFVNLSLTESKNKIEIDGGEGVGIVTKPGLGLEINKAAINPTPKKMIFENIQEIGISLLEKNGVKIIISVPKGKELAPKTDNPRLGIVNGISILGTSGIVIPFSTASYAASIRQNLDVAIAMGDKKVVLTTGGRSEDFAKKIIDYPEHCFVQMGDFSGYTIQQCGKKGIEKAFIVGFIGKFAKMATGVKQTHVKGSKVNMKFLSELAKEANASIDVVKKIEKANTARHVLEIIKESGENEFFNFVCREVYSQMRNHSKQDVTIEVILFDFDGQVLAKHAG